MQAAFEIGQKVVAKVSLKSFSEEFQQSYAVTGFGVVTKIDDRLPHILYRIAVMGASDWFDECQLECVPTLENLVVDIEGERKMTNHEQFIILRWLIDERERLMGDYIRLRDEGNRAEAEDTLRASIYVTDSYDRVAALDTSTPVLTDAERKAQAAGIMGKMSRNGVA